MDLNLFGKKVLVTGSSKGIGLGIATFFYDEGCNVVFNGRNKKNLYKLKKKFNKSKFLVGDVSNFSTAKKIVKKAAQALGGLDIIICNVGKSRPSKKDENIFSWTEMFNMNFWSAVNVIESSKQHLIKSKGNIVCISSICGNEIIPGAPITYSTAKASLNAYVKFSAKSLGKFGVRINAIAPGNIFFKNSVWDKKIKKNRKKIKKLIKENVSLNKFGSIKDVANLAGYLASPNNSFVTGSIWVLDGCQLKKI